MARLVDRPFALVGVNSDKDREALAPVILEERISWRSFWNGPGGTKGPIARSYNVRSWPTIFVLDAEGIIRFKNLRGEALDRAVDALLAEMDSTPK